MSVANWVDLAHLANVSGVTIDGDGLTTYGLDVGKLAESAIGFIQSETKRAIELTEFSEVFDGGSKTIFPSQVPIVSVAELSIDGSAQIEGTDFWIYPNFIKLAATPFSGPQRVALTYDAGYDPVPADLQQVALELTLRLLMDTETKYRKGVAPDVRSIGVQPAQISYFAKGESGAYSDLVAQLAKWKRAPMVGAVQ